MNLVIDSGNTNHKCAVFHDDGLLDYLVLPKGDIAGVIKFINTVEFDSVIHSNVSNHSNELVNALSRCSNYIKFNHLTELPISIKYSTPETLGVDRIAASVGAFLQSKNKSVLVIDIGSCITFDYTNERKEYFGGAISPGLEMRFKALKTFTANLPELNFDFQNLPTLIGMSTNESIYSGVINGVIEEIKGVISRYKALNTEINIYLTGGNSDFFEKALKSSIFADQYLVLKGLNEVVKYNFEIGILK